MVRSFIGPTDWCRYELMWAYVSTPLSGVIKNGQGRGEVMFQPHYLLPIGSNESLVLCFGTGPRSNNWGQWVAII